MSKIFKTFRADDGNSPKEKESSTIIYQTHSYADIRCKQNERQ